MSERLRRLILDEIKQGGPISFARFMELALYDEQDGFFSGAPVGRRAHFVTSPHVSPVFGTLVAAMLRDAWEALDRPEPFDVVEAGAGDGTLARQILHAAEPDPGFARALRYRALEQSAGARATLQTHGVDAFATLDEAIAEPITGCILANELLDNLPFHRIAGTPEGARELRVGSDGDSLVLVQEPVPPEVAVVRPALGEERPVSPASRAFVHDCARALAAGYVFLLDYGFTGGEDVEPVRGYRNQRLVDDVLAEPGSTDITGPVDFDAVVEAARAAGLASFGPVTQRDALLALGFKKVVAHLRDEQARAQDGGDARRAVQIFGVRNEAAMLVDPQGLGALKLLALATPGLRAPAAVRAS